MNTQRNSFLIFVVAVLSFGLVLDSARGQFSRSGRSDRGGFGQRGGPFGGGGPRGGGPRGGMAGTLQQETVQAELKLNEDQKQRLLALAEQNRQPAPEMMELLSRMREASDEEREALRVEMDKLREVQKTKLEGEVQQILDPEQFGRLQQLVLQNRGVGALKDDDVATDLNLTEAQRGQIQEISDSTDEQRRALFEGLRDIPREERMTAMEEMRTKGEALQKQRDEKLLAVLTAEQKNAWEKKLGPPLPETDQSQAPTPQAAPSATTPSVPVASSPITQTPLPPTESVGSIQTAPNGTPMPQQTVASFAPTSSGEEPAAQPKEAPPFAADTSQTPAASEPANSKHPEKLSFNFQLAPWVDVLKLFAEAAGLSLDLNDVPPGTFTYYDDGEYTPTEALNIINGYLMQKGYIVVRRDRFAVVFNIDKGVPPNLIPDVSIDELSDRADNEMVRIVLPLKGKDAATAQQEVQQILGPQGKAVAMTVTNTLVVSGLVRNVQRVRMLLEEYLVETEKDVVFRAFPLRHIAVSDAERILRDLLGLSRGVQNVSAGASGSSSPGGFMSRFAPGGFGGFGGPGGRSGGRFGGFSRDNSRESSRSTPTSTRSTTTTTSSSTVALAVDERTNTLLVSASPAQIEIVEEAITTIDVERTGEESRSFASQKQNEPYLEVYTTQNADATEVTKTLDVLFPGTVVNEDRRYGRIHIFATATEQREIASMIQRLDGMGGATTVAVIPTGPADPLTITSTLQSLYGRDAENAPSIVANPGQLVVRGTAEQVAQVRMLLQQMGITGEGYGLGSGRVRSIPLGGRDAQDFIRLLQRISPYPIRVNTPADSGPIQDQRVPSATNPVVPKTEPDDSGAATSNPPSANNAVFSVSDSFAMADETAKPQEQPMGPAKSEPAKPPKPPVQTSGEKPASLPATPPKSDPKEQADSAPPAQNAPAPEVTPQPEPKPQPDGNSQEAPEIFVEIQGNNLVLSSTDEEALNVVEEWVYRLSQQLPERTGWTVFYLRSADATEAAAMIERLFPGSSVTSSTPSSGLMGTMSRFGSSLMQSAGLSSVATTSQTLQIIPETRLNALFVAGPSDEVRDVENVLKVLDASELPEQLRDRAPRTIAIYHADATQVADIVRSVYSDEMEADRDRGGDRGNPIAMMFGGRGSSRTTNAREQVRLTLGVDTTTNQLIVSANDSLFRQVEELVKELDNAAFEARQTVRVVNVQTSNAEAVQQALTTMIPKLSVSTSSGRSTSARTTGASSNSGARPPGFGGGASPDQIRQMIMQRLQQGGGGPGGRSSSGFQPGGRTSQRGSSGFNPGGGRFGGGRSGGGRPGGGR